VRVFFKKMKTLATGHTALAKSMAYFFILQRERWVSLPPCDLYWLAWGVARWIGALTWFIRTSVVT